MGSKSAAMVVALLAATSSEMCTAGEPGFYVAATLGQARQDIGVGPAPVVSFGGLGALVAAQLDSHRVDGDDPAWNATLGYRVNEHFAAELSYMDFGDARVTDTYQVPGGGPFFPGIPAQLTRTYEARTAGPAVSVLGSLPVGSSWRFFLRGGVLFADQKIVLFNSFSSQQFTFGDKVWLAGAGVDWTFAPRWTARLDYQMSDDLERNLMSGENGVEQLAVSVLFRL